MTAEALLVTLFEALALAVLQGLTEFLPVSSSGHLVLAGSFFENFDSGNLALIIILHLATALAAALYYRRELISLAVGVLGRRKEDVRLLALLAVATTVTAVIGLNFESFFESLFSTPRAAAAGLFATGAILIAVSRLSPPVGSLATLTWQRALLIGLAQGIAIIPGVSRSGTTIAAGIFLGLSREESVRFSFFLLIPATLGAALLHATDLASAGTANLVLSAAGFATATAVGYASILLVLKWTGSGRLWYFGIYCWCAALFAVTVL